MQQVMADASLPSKLTSVIEPVQVIAADGRVLGHYLPASDKCGFVWEPPIDEVELQRREEGPPGRPLSAILADLEARP